jgi:hypothetical protein
MASVEDAVQVAQTLRPVERWGTSAVEGPVRRIHPHYFVGGNADAAHLSQGPDHAQMAVARLKSAARLELTGPSQASPLSDLTIEVAVQNVAAGHNLPTGVTELRQMWLELNVTDAAGKSVYESGLVYDTGRFGVDTISFGTVAGDDQGRPTYKPWEMAQFLRKRTIPPKGVARESVSITVPGDLSGPLTIEARLLYRSAPPEVVEWLFPEGGYVPLITEMALAKSTVMLTDKPSAER